MVVSILLALFSLSLAGFVFYVCRFDTLEHSDQRFNNIVKVFMTLILIHCLLIYMEIGTPMALLYGPIHLSLHRISKQNKQNKYLILQLVPFVVMAIAYCILSYFIQVKSVWVDSLMIYYPVVFVCMIVATLAYGTYIWSTQTGSNRRQQQLVLQLASVTFVIAFFLFVFFLIQVTDLSEEGVGFNPSYIVYGLMLVLIFLMISYLLKESGQGIKGSVDSVKYENEKYFAYSIERDILEDYALKVESVITDKRLYLRSDFSLDDLQNETAIPKHHLSQLFNSYYGKTFYNYIAEKRIEEVVLRINQDANITLESLAFECGFNSKTSFNKYFKEITGVTPSEYRNRMTM